MDTPKGSEPEEAGSLEVSAGVSAGGSAGGFAGLSSPIKVVGPGSVSLNGSGVGPVAGACAGAGAVSAGDDGSGNSAGVSCCGCCGCCC